MWVWEEGYIRYRKNKVYFLGASKLQCKVDILPLTHKNKGTMKSLIKNLSNVWKNQAVSCGRVGWVTFQGPPQTGLTAAFMLAQKYRKTFKKWTRMVDSSSSFSVLHLRVWYPHSSFNWTHLLRVHPWRTPDGVYGDETCQFTSLHGNKGYVSKKVCLKRPRLQYVVHILPNCKLKHKHWYSRKN